MAFKFPDPNVTPEFIGDNGITYSWDFDDAKWVVKTIKIQKSMKVIQTTGSISLGDIHKRPSSSNWWMRYEIRNTNDPYAYLTPGNGFRWFGQNPETGRLIFCDDKGWFGWSDDEGQTWTPTTTMSYMWNPGSGQSSNNIYKEDLAENQDRPMIWCGGKQWIVRSGTSFGYILYTLDDFETIFSCKFDKSDNQLGGGIWSCLKYDPVNDEIWTTWGEGKIMQLDSQMDTWLNSSRGTQYGTHLLSWTDGADKGVLYKKQIALRQGTYSGSTTEHSFMDIGLSGHGTKLAYSSWGIIVRSEDNFQTWEEINCLTTSNDPYNVKASTDNYNSNPVLGDSFNKARIMYIEETGVWVLVTRASFQVSFDDGFSWAEIDYKTRATKEDTYVAPYVPSPDYINNDKNYAGRYFYYYPPITNNYNAGYLKNHYYYITQEVGKPKRSSYNKTKLANGEGLPEKQNESYNAWCWENVMYVTEDLKNWTRIPFGIDIGYTNHSSTSSDRGTINTGTETAFISHQPGGDRIFLLSDGYYKQNRNRVNYIDGFK
jgi:hypothetical protein